MPPFTSIVICRMRGLLAALISCFVGASAWGAKIHTPRTLEDHLRQQVEVLEKQVAEILVPNSSPRGSIFANLRQGTQNQFELISASGASCRGTLQTKTFLIQDMVCENLATELSENRQLRYKLYQVQVRGNPQVQAQGDIFKISGERLLCDSAEPCLKLKAPKNLAIQVVENRRLEAVEQAQASAQGGGTVVLSLPPSAVGGMLSSGAQPASSSTLPLDSAGIESSEMQSSAADPNAASEITENGEPRGDQKENKKQSENSGQKNWQNNEENIRQNQSGEAQSIKNDEVQGFQNNETQNQGNDYGFQAVEGNN